MKSCGQTTRISNSDTTRPCRGDRVRLVDRRLARLRHPAMSAQRSLTGGKRTLLGHLHGGVSPLESYTGPRDLLSNAAAAAAGVGGGGTHKIEGGADLRIAFEGAPADTKARLQSWGRFSDVGKVDWGFGMPLSDPGQALR
jgi:hypothetical protein